MDLKASASSQWGSGVKSTRLAGSLRLSVFRWKVLDTRTQLLVFEWSRSFKMWVTSLSDLFVQVFKNPNRVRWLSTFRFGRRDEWFWWYVTVIAQTVCLNVTVKILILPYLLCALQTVSFTRRENQTPWTHNQHSDESDPKYAQKSYLKG